MSLLISRQLDTLSTLPVYLTFITKTLIISVTFSALFQPVAAFGAGNIPNFTFLNDKAFRHGDIEEVLTALVKNTHFGGAAGLWGILIAIFSLGRITGGDKFNHMDAKRIYFGNWLRDYSQAMDIGGLKLFTAPTLQMIISVVGFMTFGFATEEFEINPERLGVYKPVEHIDNPKGYGEAEGDARQFHPDLRPPVDPKELEINPNTGMKNYIATEGESWDTSTAHVRRTLLECIALGRKSGMKENLFQFEAFRLLGSALHTLEDLPAHSNWCELALRKLGHQEVFCHVGDAVLVDTPLGPAPPLVTGTFGAADFIHSVLGEGMDRLAEASMSNLASKLDESRDKAESHIPVLHDLLSEFIHSSQSHSDKMQQAEAMKSEAFDFDVNQLTPSEIQDFIWRLLQWRDSVFKDVLRTISFIPGLSSLFETLSETLNAFIYSLLDPILQPILQDIITHLQQHSEEAINNHEQFIVFDDPNSSDPSHSLLAKDHLSLILNEPAGKVARVIVEYTVALVVKAWCDEYVVPDKTVDKILEAFHHPFFASQDSQIQKKMIDCMYTWFASLSPEDSQKVLEGLTKEGVRTGKNKRFATREELEAREEAFKQEQEAYKREQEALRQARLEALRAPPPPPARPSPLSRSSTPPVPKSKSPPLKKSERTERGLRYEPRQGEPSFNRFDIRTRSYLDEGSYTSQQYGSDSDDDEEFWTNPNTFAKAHRRSATQPDVLVGSSSKKAGTGTTPRRTSYRAPPQPQPPTHPLDADIPDVPIPINVHLPSPEVLSESLLKDMQAGFQKALDSQSRSSNKASTDKDKVLYPRLAPRHFARQRSMSFGDRPRSPESLDDGDPEIFREPRNPVGAVFHRYDSIRSHGHQENPPLFLRSHIR